MFRWASLFIATPFTVAVFTIFATSNVDLIVGIPPGGVLGQVSDRDAPHRPSTRNATRVKKGVETIHFAQFW